MLLSIFISLILGDRFPRDSALTKTQKEMKVAVKYLKQDQQLNSITTESKPMPVLFEELKHEVAALVAMKPHPHIAGLEGVVAKFPEEGDPCQQVIYRCLIACAVLQTRLGCGG